MHLFKERKIMDIINISVTNMVKLQNQRTIWFKKWGLKVDKQGTVVLSNTLRAHRWMMSIEITEPSSSLELKQPCQCILNVQY
uniref:Uncharacterized protein n=1 Tax=Arion vulgaris TaxID=1028688 RepID=A0A0B7A0W8_9EUPU